MVEHQAGIQILDGPLSGNSSDKTDFGPVVRDHLAQVHITSGTTYMVAESALYSEDNLHQLDETGTQLDSPVSPRP